MVTTNEENSWYSNQQVVEINQWLDQYMRQQCKASVRLDELTNATHIGIGKPSNMKRSLADDI